MIEIPTTATENQILAICHSATAVPTGILIAIGSVLILMLSSLFIFDFKKTNWNKVFMLIFFSAILIGALTWALVTSPNLVQKIASIFS